MCRGGVLVIDEAYSLGNPEQRDSFSKECIDTLNQNLTENKNNFMCIIVGYKEALEECFFSYNAGLSRRFNFRYTIDEYTPANLRLILIKLIKEQDWKIQEPETESLPLVFFEKHHSEFTNFGGDMETLLFNIKISHSKRVFMLKHDVKKIIIKEDLFNGHKKFLDNKESGKKNPIPAYLQNMYI